jgi:hypothetical protein
MISDELRSLYPDLSDDELSAAKENLDQYLLLAWEIIIEDGHRDGAVFDAAERES